MDYDSGDTWGFVGAIGAGFTAKTRWGKVEDLKVTPPSVKGTVQRTMERMGLV